MQHLRGGHVSVASKQVISITTEQNAACFVSVADRGLRPKASFRKQKRQQGCWRSGVRSQLYPRITIRRARLLVKEKVGTRERDRRERTKAAACDRRPRHAAPTERCSDRDL